MDFLKAVTFSYDDGVTQDIRLINLLNKYNLKATFNLNSERLGRGDTHICRDTMVSHYKVKKEQVREIYKGHEVAVHTLTHPNLTTLPDEEVIYQVEQDRLNLSELVGYEVVGMAYPCGGVNNDDRVAEIIKNHTGVKYSRTIADSHNFDLQQNLFRFNPSVYHLDFDIMMELGQKFVDLKPEKPQVFYIWGHSYEMDIDNSYWQKLEEFFKLISNKKDIIYKTNKEILL